MQRTVASFGALPIVVRTEYQELVELKRRSFVNLRPPRALRQESFPELGLLPLEPLLGGPPPPLPPPPSLPGGDLVRDWERNGDTVDGGDRPWRATMTISSSSMDRSD